MSTIAIFGAAGNMGTRVSRTLAAAGGHELLYVEATEAGIEKLRARGHEPTPADVACGRADVVVLALPDILIGRVARQIVPLLLPGTLVMTLDPAAAAAGRLPERPDISYFVTHPAHPPVFNDETAMEARRDFFGSGLAKQAIVSALMQGPDEDYARGEQIASEMFGPVLRSHRVTVEQMAILEPVLSETVAATCLSVIREALDEAAARGIPYEAARDFLMGHLNIELAILFNEIDWNFSAGAQQAIAEAKKVLFKDDWKRVFDEKEWAASVWRISGGDAG
ncbi:MAG: NAD(P)-binding domain-containing protein [Bryobacteraceae bacterium]|nr:NAD(P)-binding domain-containing protein [Bryobacteraceae bacterium]